MSAPSKLILTNQFGEESENVVSGAAQPLVPGSSNIVSFAGATAPIDGTTGHLFAEKGSFYFAIDTGVLYRNTGTAASPVWSSSGTTTSAAIIATALTGFLAGAGTVSAADSILQAINKIVGNQAVLQNGTPTFQSETVSAAGALSTTKAESLINNASGSGFAVTLAAPSSQDGQLKVIKLGTATHNATLAMTNIATPGFVTPTGTTTLTFTSTGDCAILMAVGAKWQLIGGSAVAS